MKRIFFIVFLLFFLFNMGSASPPASWVDQGNLFSNSGSGFDHSYAGWAPSTAVKLGSTYYLYYICVDGGRPYGGPANRSVCVATSINGISFSKYGSNPVIQHQPNSHEEEGVFSAVALVNGGTIYMYYGGIVCASSCTIGQDASVDINIRVATSTDGTTFANHEEVWSGVDNGSENTPFGVVNQSGTANGNAGSWFVYYGREKPTGILYGSSYNALSKAGDLSGLTIGSDWKGSSFVYDSTDNKVYGFTDSPVDAWSASLSTLHSFSDESNDPGYTNIQGGALLIDGTAWYWFYRSAGYNNITNDTDTISLYTYNTASPFSGINIK
jgi:hypothetical protein